MRVRINEALTPAQKLSVDKDIEEGNIKVNDYSFSHHAFPSPTHSRVAIPLRSSGRGHHEDEISDHLEKHGYTVHDYREGLAKDKFGRLVKIGKALGKTGGEHLASKFSGDPVRQQKSGHEDLHVVISRHPHDVMGMTSKGHSWESSSCMNFETGMNRHFLPNEVEHGTHVAYLTHKDDHDISKPLARLALKPYESPEGHKIIHPEVRVYGNAPDSFVHTVAHWTKTNFQPKGDALYRKNKDIYDDSGNNLIGSHKAIADALASDDDHGYTKERLIEKGPLDSKHVDSILSNGSSYHAELLLNNKFADIRDHHLKSILTNPKVTPSSVRLVAKHPSLSSDTVDAIMSHPNYRKSISVRENLYKSPAFSAKHVDKALDDSSIGDNEKGLIITTNPNVHGEHVSKLADKIGAYKALDWISQSRLDNKKLQKHMLDMVDASSHTPAEKRYFRQGAAANWGRSLALSHRLVDSAIKELADNRGADSSMHVGAIGRQLSSGPMDKPLAKKLLDMTASIPSHDPDSQGFNLKKLSRSHYTAENLLKFHSEHLDEGDLDKIVHPDSYAGTFNIDALAAHPKFSSKHVDALFSHPDDDVVSGAIKSLIPMEDRHVEQVKNIYARSLATRAGDHIRFRDHIDGLMLNDPDKELANHYLSHRLPSTISFKHSLAASKLDPYKMAKESRTVTHPDAPEEVKSFFLNHEDHNLVANYLDHKANYDHGNLDSKHLDSLIERNHPAINESLARNGFVKPTFGEHRVDTFVDNLLDTHHPLHADALSGLVHQPSMHNTTEGQRQLRRIAKQVTHKIAGKTDDYSNHLGSTLAEVASNQNLPSGVVNDMHDKLQDHTEVMARVVRHRNLSYDRWKKHRTETESPYHIESLSTHNIEHHATFNKERLNESVLSGKMKVWILT